MQAWHKTGKRETQGRPVEEASLQASDAAAETIIKRTYTTTNKQHVIRHQFPVRHRATTEMENYPLPQSVAKPSGKNSSAERPATFDSVSASDNLRTTSIKVMPVIEPLQGKKYTHSAVHSSLARRSIDRSLELTATQTPKIRGQSIPNAKLRNISILQTTKAGKSGAMLQSLVGVDGIPGEKLFTGSRSPIVTRV